MTRSDLIAILAEKHPELQPNVVDNLVREIIEQMVKSLSESKRIEIRGFGSFEVRVRSPRIAHNPKTGDRVTVEERRVVHFKPGMQLKTKVNTLESLNTKGED